MDNRIKKPPGWSDQLFADILNMDYYGSKCCTCMKNHCLKHYCECFTAGLFCVESCACKDCDNIPENKAKILDRREKIESQYLQWILPFGYEVSASTEDSNRSESDALVAANSDFTCFSTPITDCSNKRIKISSPTILPVCFTGEIYCKDTRDHEDLKVVSAPASTEDDPIEIDKSTKVLETPQNFECSSPPKVVSVPPISTEVNRIESQYALVANDSDTCLTTSIIKSCNETMKIFSNFGEAHGSIKCRCKKGRCSKLNCKCFAAGEFCLKSCTCEDCNNIAEAREEIESLMCQCKKSRCIKYLCGCFAARKYCTGKCACQGCCNNPENEQKVIEVRNEKERHGCKCCRGTCLTVRCPCHKGKVGCSDACKCKGCGNSYGQNPKRRYDNSDKNIR